MARWSRNPELPPEAHGLALTAEEGFVLSRLDVALTRDQLVEQTGLPAERIDNILSLLEDKRLALSDEPPLRLAMETIPDLPADDDDDDEVTGKYSKPPSAPPPAPSAPPPPPPPRPFEPHDLDPNVLDASFKQVYDRDFARLPVETRIAHSGREGGMTLLALCHDPEPAVIGAIMMNHECVPSHARIIALNHTSALGLEQLTRRRDLLADAQVEWLLLRNPMLSQDLAQQLLAPKALGDLYAVWSDEVVAEPARAIARDTIRTLFGAAPATERAALITHTEGNVLQALAGLTLDGRTVTLLSSAPYTSVVFVRNLIKFTACPGPLLGYLSKQSLVRRNPQLRNMLLQHPNLPAELRRQR